MKAVKLGSLLVRRLAESEVWQTSWQVAGLSLPLGLYGPFVAIGGMVGVIYVFEQLHTVPSCHWRDWDCLYSGAGAVIFGESRGPEDAFYTPLGFTIFLSLLVGIGKLIVGGVNLFYNEKRHLELLAAERAEAVAAVRAEAARERTAEWEREQVAMVAEREQAVTEREQAVAEREQAVAERARAVAVLEWYARHKDQLPDVPPPPGMERNGH